MTKRQAQVLIAVSVLILVAASVVAMRAWPQQAAELAPSIQPYAVQQRDITELLGITASGQATMSKSLPVAIASDQDVIIPNPTMYATVLVSQTVTTTVTSSQMTTPYAAKGGYLLWDLLAVPGSSPTITLYVDAYDSIQGDYSCIYQTDGQTSTTKKEILVYPGATDTDSQLLEVCELPLPDRWRIRVIPTTPGGTSWMYSVAVSYVP